MESPLAEVQREKSGATTFSKYDYQYHWALCRLIKEHEKSNDYAIIIELHEDVVLATSLDLIRVEFEFNQIKNLSGNPLTLKSIIYLTNGSSILGKLCSSFDRKRYSDKLRNVNLVATCGFNFELKNKGLDLEVIKHGDLSDNTVEELKKALEAELGLKSLPDKIQFIISDLPTFGFQDHVIGKIACLVNKLHPGSHCNSVDIYRAIMDDLRRKGENTHDYIEWEELLDNKAVTSSQVEAIINMFTSLDDTEFVKNCFNQITKDLGLDFVKSNALNKSLNRYRLAQISSRNQVNRLISETIKRKLLAVLEEEKDTKEIIETVYSNLDDTLKNKIGVENDIKAAIIYELIIMAQNESK